MKQNKSYIIAVDFDGTLCTNKYPEIGEPVSRVIEYVKRKKEEGCKIILWTCRTGEKLQEAVQWCVDRGIIFDTINANVAEIIDTFDSESRKIFAHEYIDDRAVGIDEQNCWRDISNPPDKKEHDWVLVKCVFTATKDDPVPQYSIPHVAELRDGVWWSDADIPLESVGLTVVEWFDMETIKGGSLLSWSD